jgi:ferredoxin
VRDVAQSAATELSMDRTIVMGIAAVAVNTLQQVGLEALRAAPGAVTLDAATLARTPRQVLAARARDDRQGLFGSLRGERKVWTVTFDERDPEGRFSLINTQALTTAAAADPRDWRARDPRCAEGPIPVQCRSASCGTCWVGVLGGADKLSDVEPRERERLREFGYADTSTARPLIRLACQASATGAVSIVIPPWNGVFGRALERHGARGGPHAECGDAECVEGEAVACGLSRGADDRNAAVLRNRAHQRFSFDMSLLQSRSCTFRRHPAFRIHAAFCVFILHSACLILHSSLRPLEYTLMSFPRLTPEEAASYIDNGHFVGFSGFTPAGAAKLVPRALATRAKAEHAAGRPFRVRVMTGASTGDLDDLLAEAEAVSWRAPYQSSARLRKQINEGSVEFVDMHLSHVPQALLFGFFGDIDVAVVEASDVTADGRVYLTTSIGATPTCCTGRRRSSSRSTGATRRGCGR